MTFDILIKMVSGRDHTISKVTEDDYKALMEGWADPENFIVGIPGFGDSQLKFLVRSQIEMVVVDIVQSEV